MHRNDDWLRYGAKVPLERILSHRRLHALSKLGLELRRAAARSLNDALAQAHRTRIGLSRETGIDHFALTQICTARRAMDPELLKRALQALGKDWRALEVEFSEAIDYRGRMYPANSEQSARAPLSPPLKPSLATGSP
ncbi:MAG TPA: hypothetical protein VK043_04975 [Burkholderiales bacterium]|nr:hypothetical protein [Burkholderiales bacterium]